jgi:SAM-dependent methyltransferase
MGNPTDYLVGTGESGPRLGAAFNVVTDVHVDDSSFQELCKAQDGDQERALNHYLHEGRVDAEFVRDVIADMQGAPVYDGRIVAPMTILDFDAGYGRVARHLKNVVPNAKVVAVDTRDTAMYFNTSHLGLQAAVAATDPARLSPFFEFDVVLALSFFSTLRESRIGAWLVALAGFAKPGGIFVVTMPASAGAHSMLREIERVRRLSLVLFRAAATRTHGDVFVMRKVN